MSALEDRLRLTAHDALTHWALQPVRVELVSRSENVVFKVTDADDKHYALRIHRPGYNSQAELEAELIWTDALNAAGIRTPAHLLTRHGEGYADVTLHGTGEHHQVGLIEWLPGELLSTLIRTASNAQADAYFFALGQLIGRLHEQTAAWTPPAQFQRRAWDADGLVGSDPLWGRFWEARVLTADESNLLASVRAKLHERLKGLSRNSDVFGLMHADLHPYNVIIHRDVLHPIDFDDCGFGWYYYDLAVALSQFEEHVRIGALRAHLLDGYASVRSLPDVQALLPVFSLIRGLVTIGWADARPELADEQAVRARAEPVLEPARAYLESKPA